MSKVITINSRKDLQNLRVAETGSSQIKVNIANFTPKEIVKFVLKHENNADVWIRTKALSCIPEDRWLIFRRKKAWSPRPYRLKRAMDVSLGALSLIVSLPLFVIASILVKLSSKGSALFRQPRVDNNMKIFGLYKFRTMNTSDEGEKVHQDYMRNNIRNHPEILNSFQSRDKKEVYKLIDDPRITPIGKWFRRFSLDELPQLINVLKGEMSLVGPRPPIPYEVEEYKNWHFARFRAKPGLTGLWQVTGRSLIPFHEMVVLDLYYALNQSFWFDLKILLRTIPMVLSLRGAF